MNYQLFVITLYKYKSALGGKKGLQLQMKNELMCQKARRKLLFLLHLCKKH